MQILRYANDKKILLNVSKSHINPIRSGVFEIVNDTGGGGVTLKVPPSHNLENYCSNCYYIIHAHFTRCLTHVPIRIFLKIHEFDHFTPISK